MPGTATWIGSSATSARPGSLSPRSMPKSRSVPAYPRARDRYGDRRSMPWRSTAALPGPSGPTWSSFTSGACPMATLSSSGTSRPSRRVATLPSNTVSPSRSKPSLHPGQGRIDFPALFRRLAARQFRGNLSLEASSMDREGCVDLERVQRSLDMIEKQVAGKGGGHG